MKMVRYTKYQAVGNAYAILEMAAPPSPEQIRALCHPAYGLGGDGILIGRAQNEGVFHLRIFNPDGSEAEKSGNGLRIYARYLADQGQIGNKPFPIETAGGKIVAAVAADLDEVTVDMGVVSFSSEDVPVAGPPREVIEERLRLGTSDLVYCAASIGNPHCVVLVDKLDEKFSRRLGPQIESNPLFPQRTNVQFLQVIDRSHIALHIWERGAGFTLSSGSSSCAAAAVAVRLGLCEREVMVQMPGGQLVVTIDEDFRAFLRGPVAFVSRGVVALPD